MFDAFVWTHDSVKIVEGW